MLNENSPDVQSVHSKPESLAEAIRAAEQAGRFVTDARDSLDEDEQEDGTPSITAARLMAAQSALIEVHQAHGSLLAYIKQLEVESESGSVSAEMLLATEAELERQRLINQERRHKLEGERDTLATMLAALLDHAERIQEHIPKSENWYAVRDGARAALARTEEQ